MARTKAAKAGKRVAAGGKGKGQKLTLAKRQPGYVVNADLAGLLRPLSSLRPDPENVRLHPERNLQAIRASLQRFGQQKPVVALKDGTVIAGNGLLMAARELGWTHIAAVVLPTEDKNEARAYALADNRTAELSKWDHAALANMLRALPEVGDLGWDAEELRMLTSANWQPGEPQEGGLDGQHTYRVPFTAEQYEVVMRACTKMREQEPGEPEMSDGRCLELVCAEFLS